MCQGKEKDQRQVSYKVQSASVANLSLPLSHLYPLQTDAYDNRKTKGTQTSSIRDVCYADRNGYRIRYIGYASTSYYIEFMSDILIEEMEDNNN